MVSDMKVFPSGLGAIVGFTAKVTVAAGEDDATGEVDGMIFVVGIGSSVGVGSVVVCGFPVFRWIYTHTQSNRFPGLLRNRCCRPEPYLRSKMQPPFYLK